VLEGQRRDVLHMDVGAMSAAGSPSRSEEG
jgi:hypothetical protein